MNPLEWKTYIFNSSHDEIQEFFNCFTAEQRNNEFKPLFDVINVCLYEKDPTKYVLNYFTYRKLIIQEVSNDNLIIALKNIISTNEKAWKDYTGGKDSVIGRFVGLLAKATGVSPVEAKKFIEANKTI